MPRAAEDEGERHRRREKRKKLMEQTLRAIQADNLRLREQVEQLNQAQAADALPLQQNDQPANEVAQIDADARLASKIHRKAIAASAGRRAAVLHMPFMDRFYLFDHRVLELLPRLIADVKKASLDPADPEADENEEELDNRINPNKWWDCWRFGIPDAPDMVREILFNMPPGAEKWWFKDWFQASFHEGYRKIRGDIAHRVAKNYRTIFGIDNNQFADKKVRATLPEVQALLGSFQYQNREDREGVSDPNTVFRHDCIVKTIRYIYWGESAIATGIRSQKARDSHMELWRIAEVTPAVIAFAVTVIHFVLSGEPSFERCSATSNYGAFFHGRLMIMENLYDDYPEIFANLIGDLNRSVLPGQYQVEEEMEYDGGVAPPAPVGLSQQDVAFIENW